jgi:hypothetical protein
MPGSLTSPPPWLNNGSTPAAGKPKKSRRFKVSLVTAAAVLAGTSGWNALHPTVGLADAAFGQCIPEVSSARKNVSELGSVSCSKPHSGEIYFTADMQATSRPYPGSPAVRTEAGQRCEDEVTPTIKNTPHDDDWSIIFVAPSQPDMWVAGSRLVCIIKFPSPRSGSVVKPAK